MVDRDDTRDGMIRYGFYAGLALAALCMILTIAYLFLYFRSIEESFASSLPAYLKDYDANNLTIVIVARTALNKTLLQSCGIVCGIAFGFVGLSLFLLGTRGNIDAEVTGGGNSFKFNRLTPGTAVILASLVLIGFSANHQVPLQLGPQGSSTGFPLKAPPNASSTPQHDIPPSNTWKSDDSQL